jgi:Rod binding domain-containing protein
LPLPPGFAEFAGALGGLSASPEGFLRPSAAVPSAFLDVQSQLQSVLADTSRSEIGPSSAEDAAKDFAGILFGYMFSEMRPKADDDEGGLLGGGDSELFMDFFDRAMGKHFVDGAGGPLVEALVKQLTKGGQYQTDSDQAGRTDT